MGIHLSTNDISDSLDQEQFQINLKKEINEFKNIFIQEQDENDEWTVGIELEFFLTTLQYQPANCIDDLLMKLKSDDNYSEETTQSCIEVMSRPIKLTGDALSSIQSQIENHYKLLKNVANKLNYQVIQIGILPTSRLENYSNVSLTNTNRYKTIEKFFFSKGIKKIILRGKDICAFETNTMAMMGSCSAFQINLRVDKKLVSACYNASLMMAGPLIAISANSPCLFGRNLWAETRIPLLEQLFSCSHFVSRVHFGNDYLISPIYHYLSQLFCQHFPVIPYCYKKDDEKFKHLQLHNSTIYPWVRLVIDNDKKTNTPYMRIEFRCLPSGPSLKDMIANLALYIGLIHYFIKVKKNMPLLPFNQARHNFYHAAKYGLGTHLYWFNQKIVAVELIQQLLPLAYIGLMSLKLNRDEIDYYFHMIKSRILNNISGSQWQLNMLEKYSLNDMLFAYLEKQERFHSVSDW